MRLGIIASLVVASGCSEEPSSGPAVDSFVETYNFGATLPPRIDLLIVVDDTTAMADHADVVAAIGAEAAEAYLDAAGDEPDIRVAVTTTAASGALRAPAVVAEPYLELTYNERYERASNVAGSFADALTALVNVGATATHAVQPLEAIEQAVATADFVRPDAALAILTVAASDDASSGVPADIAAALRALKPDPTRVFAMGLYPMGAARLDAFHAGFPNRALVDDLDVANLPAAVRFVNQLPRILGVPCGPEPADVDASMAGPQYECDMGIYYEDGTSAPVRQCQPESTGPCFEFVTDAACGLPDVKRFVARGFPTQYRPRIAGQCVVTGEN